MLTIEAIGQGRPILYLHGWGFDSQIWHRQVDFFRSGYRNCVVDYNLRDLPPEITYDTLLDHLCTLILERWDDPGTPPYASYMPLGLWRGIVEALAAEGLSVVVYRFRHPEPPRICIASERGDPHFESYVGRNRDFTRVVPDLARAEFDDVIEVAALGSGPAFDAASERVRRRFSGLAEHHTMVLFIAAQFGKITEFFRPDTSKWHAFLAMFPDAATHPEQVIAVGDEANDREMIAAAGLGIVMGNAPPELRAIADRVTDHHDDDGLALALEPILEEMERGISPVNRAMGDRSG